MPLEGDFKTVEIPLLPRAWWDIDPELAEATRALFGKIRIIDMPASLAAQFGSTRHIPSKTAIARYMSHLRGGPFKGQKRPPPSAKSRIKSANPAK